MSSIKLGPKTFLLYMHYFVIRNFLCAAKNLQLPQNTIFWGNGQDIHNLKRNRLENNCSENELPLNPCFNAIIRRSASGSVVQKRLSGIKIPKVFGRHFAVIGNNLYYIYSGIYGKWGRSCGSAHRFLPPSRDRRWLLQISRILKNHDVPDFEFTFYMNDIPPPRAFTLLPTFSFSKLKRSNVIPFPFLKLDFSENLALPAKDTVYEQLRMKSELIKFQDRKDQLIWVGGIKNNDKRVSKTSARMLTEDMQKESPDDIYVPNENLSFIRQAKYKYILSLAGRGFTWFLSYALLTGSLVFVQEINAEQWYQADLVPYIHYIPIKSDLSNLTKQIDWARKNPKEAEVIAMRAREFALKYLSPEAIESAAIDVLQHVAQRYRSSSVVSRLPRRSTVNACAMNVADCASALVCQNCLNCQTYDF